MKAMILAAGRGERMGALTDNCPKPLLRVGDYCLIEHHLIRLAEAGVQDVVINLWYLGDQIQEYLGQSIYGLRLYYSVEKQLLGTGGGVQKALPLLGDEPFLLLSADVWTDYPLEQLPKKLSGLAHLVLVDNPPFHPNGDYSLNQSYLSHDFQHRLNYAGFGILDPQLFNDCPNVPFEIGALFSKAVEMKQVTGEHYQGAWFNVGTPDILKTLDEYLV